MNVGDYGTILRFQVLDEGQVVDVSACTSILLTLQKPDETKTIKTAVLDTDGKNGFVKYQTLVSDIDQDGTWIAQVHTSWSGSGFSSSMTSFVVGKVL